MKKIVNSVLGICLFPFVSFAQNQVHSLQQPRDQEEMNFAKVQTEKSRKFLDSDPALLEKIRLRGAELAPQNAPLRTNFFGVEYGIQKGSLIKFGSSGGNDETLVDASELSKGAAIADYRVSPDQQKIVYGVAINGSDWQTWYILDLQSKKKLDVPIQFKNIGGGEVSWSTDSKALVYENGLGISEDIKGLRKSQVKLHVLGTPLQTDKVLFASSEELDSSRWNAKAVDAETYLIYRDQGVAGIPLSAFLVRVTEQGVTKPEAIVPPNRFFGLFVGVKNGVAYFKSSQLGTNFGLFSVDLKTKLVRILIKPSSNEVLYQAVILSNSILTQYIGSNLNISFKAYDLSGKFLKDYKPSDFGLTNFGQPSIPLVTSDPSSTSAYFIYNSVETPTVTFRFDSETAELKKLDSKPVAFDGSKIKREVVLYTSYDGQKIPMQIFSRTDRQGPAEYAYLYNYGYIGIPNLSQYNKKFQLALDLGAIVAIAAVRGGGEYGLRWQLAGTNNRANTFQDIVYASRWLKANKDIKEHRVAVSGRSFGGMTTMAQYVNFQNEFDAFTPVASISDMNQFLLADSGWWAGDDFGVKRLADGRATPLALKAVADGTLAWSPMQNLAKLKVAKPMMAFSGADDTRVGPHQTTQFIKALQLKFGEAAPIFMIEYTGGHTVRAEFMDEALFYMKTFGLKDFQPVK